MTESNEKKIKIKLFSILPICTLREKNGKIVLKVCGIPVFKRKEKENARGNVKYYLCGIPVLKIKQRYVAK